MTLIGAGGAGKTRLASELAERWAAQARGGVWMAALAPVADAAGIGPALLAAIGLRETQLLTSGKAAPAGDAVTHAMEVLADRARAAGARQLRAPDRRGGRAGRAAAGGLPASAHPHHQPRAAGHHRGDDRPGGAAGAARRRASRPPSALEVAGGAPVRRSRGGSIGRVRAWTRTPSATSWRSAAGSTACRWRSSWRRRACAR